MNLNWLKPNWTEWARISRAVGGASAATGALLGGVSAQVAPLSALVPALAPFNGILAALGVIAWGIGETAKHLTATVEAQR